MKTKKKKQLFNPLPDMNEYEAGDGYWVGHPHNSNEANQYVIDNRNKFRMVGTIHDEDASWSYDDWCLIFDTSTKRFWLLATAGCSCPSPSETWRVEIGPATLKKVRKHVTDGAYEGYTMPAKQLNDFIAIIDKAEKELASNE